jgi:uncharacterized protein
MYMQLAMGFGLDLEVPAALETSATPSFDCRKSRTAEERTICASQPLGGLDSEIRFPLTRQGSHTARLLFG